MRKSSALLSVALVIIGLTLADCGSSPTGSSSSSKGVTLHGVALGSTASASARNVRAMSDHPGGVTVTVQGTSLTTKISVNGTFELEGLPSGTFTLVFTGSDGTVIGTVTITGVAEEVEVNVVVQVNVTTVILIKVEMGNEGENENENGDKTCAINGGTVGSGIELEGNVSSAAGSTFMMQVNGNRASALVTVNAAGAGFSCVGGAKSSDNGKGNDDNGDDSSPCDASRLTAGAKVHVSGTLTSCSTTAAAVTASSVKIQKD